MKLNFLFSFPRFSSFFLVLCPFHSIGSWLYKKCGDCIKIILVVSKAPNRYFPGMIPLIPPPPMHSIHSSFDHQMNSIHSPFFPPPIFPVCNFPPFPSKPVPILASSLGLILLPPPPPPSVIEAAAKQEQGKVPAADGTTTGEVEEAGKETLAADGVSAEETGSAEVAAESNMVRESINDDHSISMMDMIHSESRERDKLDRHRAMSGLQSVIDRVSN